MRQRIVTELDGIEKEHNVKIIFAAESGSRAWGFPSDNSDYDVRFVYAHEKDWYLTTGEKRDVVELPVDEVLDINGWDLRKSLKLMKKSNSALQEWISSPIQYRVWDKAFEKLAALSKVAFMPESSCYHYLSMAKSSAAKFDDGSGKTKLKTYMYAIRPILCCEWIIENLTQPPMRISELLAETGGDVRFREKAIELVEEKKRHSEKHAVERSEIVENYVSKKIAELPGRIPKNPRKPDLEAFDDVFRHILDQRRSIGE